MADIAPRSAWKDETSKRPCIETLEHARERRCAESDRDAREREDINREVGRAYDAYLESQRKMLSALQDYTSALERKYKRPA